jgi:hypothetical protein
MGENQELFYGVGDTAILQVFVDEDPTVSAPDITWRPLKGVGSRSALRDGSQQLVIDPVLSEDSGVYTVEIVQTVRGVVRRAMAMITLNVHGRTLV